MTASPHDAVMWGDLRSAARALTRSLTFTAATTLALGLAIGSTGAIFGLVDALWLRPPGTRNPNSLVWVFASTLADQQGAWSWSEYRGAARSFGFVQRSGRTRTPWRTPH